MNLLMVAATEMEIAPFLKTHTTSDVLLTGIGISPTVYHLTKRLLEKKYDFVLQAGIAGAFTSRLPIGEVVYINSDAFSDSGIQEKGKFRTLFEIGLMNKSEFPYKDGWLDNPHPILKTTSCPVVKAITSGQITDNSSQNRLISEKFRAESESMEGAAFHYVCLQEGIPFLQIRALSNEVGQRDKTKWELKKAIENLNKEIIKVINQIN